LRKIECYLNSRLPLFDDIESFDALTSGHFPVGSNLKSVPQSIILDITENRLSRWQMIFNGCTKNSEKFGRLITWTPHNNAENGGWLNQTYKLVTWSYSAVLIFPQPRELGPRVPGMTSWFEWLQTKSLTPRLKDRIAPSCANYPLSLLTTRRAILCLMRAKGASLSQRIVSIIFNTKFMPLIPFNFERGG